VRRAVHVVASDKRVLVYARHDQKAEAFGAAFDGTDKERPVYGRFRFARSERISAPLCPAAADGFPAPRILFRRGIFRRTLRMILLIFVFHVASLSFTLFIFYSAWFLLYKGFSFNLQK
jgi:hypothetical protein